MKVIIWIAIVGIGIANNLEAQSLPVIRANSTQVDIREGDDYREGQWSIMPEYRPDEYITHQKGSWVTFYTDLDSFRVQALPDTSYDFVILLNGKDSAFTRITYKPGHLDILKAAYAYNYQDEADWPVFQYQDSSHPDLRTLRIAYNLDSIAGGGNEVSKILHLMHWIHDLIPHDGNQENPLVKNAMSLITTCETEKRGLNCRGLATILNECYLAVGIKSRFVTCMPKDSVFNDCHVINMVYASELDKWIWIDPTHDAYIMDENGELLGIEEVRQRLISGDPLILNPDANWNRRSSTLKANYLEHYMAKNLYRFSCPAKSEYDFETNETGKVRTYIELLPLDGYNQRPKKIVKTNPNTKVIFETYKTNNPNLFWATPGDEKMQ